MARLDEVIRGIESEVIREIRTTLGRLGAAIRDRLQAGHNEACSRNWVGLGEPDVCTCGHEALEEAAAEFAGDD